MLFAVVAAHALAETARDTLFLNGLPAERLPFAYLAIALGVLLGGRAVEAGLARRSRVRALQSVLVVGALGHLAFAALATRSSPPLLYALYVWCGLVTTLLVVQFWLLLGSAFDVGSAKRAFAWVAAGGVAGAAAGAALAALLLLALPVRALLVAAALFLALAALGTLRLPGAAAPARRGDARAAPPLRDVLADPYAARLLAIAFLLALATTGADYLFKSAVAAELPPERLGHFFARYHAAVNVGALGLQLGATSWLLQRLGVTRALLVLPGLLTLGAGGVAVLGGLAPALVLKGVDDLLRPSLHGAGSEILFLPLSDRLRGELRGLASSLGQRGGQAAASLALLAALGAGASRSALAIAIAGLGAALCGAIVGLRAPYVEHFRRGLRALGKDAPVEVPRLDLQALEILIGALSSPDPDEVAAALDLLGAYDRHRLVPALILYHPEPRVVVRALALFAHDAPPTVAPLLPSLLRHRDAEVRAAAFVALAARRELPPEDERRVLDSLLDAGPGARPALASALAALEPARALAWLEPLVRSGDESVRAAVAEGVARAPSPAHLPLLVDLLASAAAREPARRALCDLGAPALAALAAALRDPSTPRRVRRHVPRSISRFGGVPASRLLTEALGVERDPGVRFKILRGLGRLRAEDPELPVDAAPILAVAEASLRRAVEMLAFELAVRVAPGDAEPTALLRRLILEKEGRALERVFRALHILDPALEYRALFEALRGEDLRAQASAREVLDHVVEGPLRDGLLAVVSPAPAAERLAGALGFHAPEGAEPLLPLAKGDEPLDVAACKLLAEPLWIAMERDEDPILAALARKARPGGRDGAR